MRVGKRLAPEREKNWRPSLAALIQQAASRFCKDADALGGG